MAEENKERKEKSREPGPLQSSPAWISIILFAAVWILILSFSGLLVPDTQSDTIPYTLFKKQLHQGQVAEVTVRGEKINGTFKKPLARETAPGQTNGQLTGEPADTQEEQSGRAVKSFQTVLPSFGDPELMGLLEKQEVVVRAETEDRSWFGTLLISLVPWLLIIGFFIYSSRKIQQRMGGMGGAGPFGFGKSKAKLYTRSTINITFEDVAGLTNAKMELQEIIDFLKDPAKFRLLGAQLPKGVLLVGPPGTGKTLMAKATAGEANVPFYSISGSEFIEMFVGVGASRVRDMFDRAKKDAPAIIFIDELDAIGRVRGTGIGGGQDEREQTLNQILSEMDGFTPNQSVVVMAATNRPDVLDPALIRPGRFDRQVRLGLPQKKARRQILELHTRHVPIAEDVNLEVVAARTVGFSGAELRNLVNEAALLAARKDRHQVTAEDFDQGRDKIIMGLEREDFMKEEEKRTVAYHEAGHALTAKLLPGADPIRKVTIIPRGQALGATEQIPEEDRYNVSYGYLLARVTVMLGGRAAEKVVFNETTTGAGDDLKNATQLVRRMVCQWGMSEKVGPMVLNQGDTHPFLGREMAEPRNFSEQTQQLVDEEIRRLIGEMQDKAERLLGENRNKLDALAQALMEHETITDQDIERLVASASPEGDAGKQGSSSGKGKDSDI